MTSLQKLRDEIKKGGSEPPCPFCQIPRVRRSDYVRCCRCGVNWLEGEALDKDPKTQRMRNMIETSTATATVKKREDHGGR